jgi:uncharacterized protein YegL
MQGAPIDELNAGLRDLARTLKDDKLASLRVELAVVAFGGRARTVDVRGAEGEIPLNATDAFVGALDFVPPTLAAKGETPMGDAVRQGLTLVRQRKELYRQHGLDYFRPWVFLITDGNPTDFGWEAAAEEVQEEERRKGVSFYVVGVEGADLAKLARFSSERQPVRLKGLAFQELFQWLSKSLQSVAQSRPGDQAPLPAVGWAVADTSH